MNARRWVNTFRRGGFSHRKSSLLSSLGLLTALALLNNPTRVDAEAKTDAGLKVTFTLSEGGAATDVDTTPNAWLYVPAGQPATPFLKSGKFSATWEGSINVDLRDSYTFSAELNGALKLEINGEVILEATGTGGTTAASKKIRLNKGANPLKIQFTSPEQGDAVLRLLWASQDIAPEPIPLNSLTHAADDAGLQKPDQLRLGRELFVEHRCAKCHITFVTERTMPEISMDAPGFEEIGSRRGAAWMAKWILDPKSQRTAKVHMPKLLHGATAKADAEAIAAYLASLKSAGEEKAPAAAADAVASGKKLADTLHCVACHNLPEATKLEPTKITLKHVAEKFPGGQLAAFLQKPDAHYRWIRMPRFKLTADEAGRLAAYLLAAAENTAATVPSSDAAIIEHGKTLVQTSGCLNCHATGSGNKLENKFTATPLADLAPAKWQGGCLAATPGDTSKAPQYGFTEVERAALQAFGATDRGSLQQHVPVEFAARQARSLNCTECHGKFEGFPTFQILGGKLRPEWSKAFIAGEISYKPRTWLESRMPAFPSRAEYLAKGLAMQHGYPPVSPEDPAFDQAAADVGRQLVGTDGGFSCIACHAIRELGATQVFESAGINFAYSGERLRPAYLRRWILNPLRIDPQTKMPVYFNDGHSPLTDIYDGDATKQINALWQYIRQGQKMPLPKDATGN